MKKLIISLLLFIPLQIVSGQDRIITIQNDTIHCRIISVSPIQILYEQREENGYMIGIFLPIERVLEYYQAPKSTKINPFFRTEGQVLKPSHRWMVGLQTGTSFLTASSVKSWKRLITEGMGMSQSQADDFGEQHKRGRHLNGAIYYMDSDNFGLGAKYSFFTSSAQIDFIVKSYGDDFPTYVCVGIKEKQYIHYIGPSIIFRQWLGKNRKFQFSEMFSTGYVHYRDELRMNATFNLDNALIEGNTWGMNGGISLDYYPVSWLSIGVNSGFTYARLTKLRISDKNTSQTGELGQEYYQYLSRLECSLGIRFSFN